MPDYSRVLGDVVKVAREQAGLTQAELATAINRDTRTVLNIENYKGNPKLEVLYPLVRALRIDSREIFYPEMRCDSPALRQPPSGSPVPPCIPNSEVWLLCQELLRRLQV